LIRESVAIAALGRKRCYMGFNPDRQEFHSWVANEISRTFVAPGNNQDRQTTPGRSGPPECTYAIHAYGFLFPNSEKVTRFSLALSIGNRSRRKLANFEK
jgi:hypothetical protein